MAASRFSARCSGSIVIPAQVAMLPLFLLLKSMGLVNTYAGVLVPVLATIFGIALIRQYALSIPDEMLEAARVDGAGEFRIFVTIVVPMLRPILVTLATFTFLGTWNDFMWPLIVLSDESLYTLPVALASLSREHVQDNELMMAGSVDHGPAGAGALSRLAAPVPRWAAGRECQGMTDTRSRPRAALCWRLRLARGSLAGVAQCRPRSREKRGCSTASKRSSRGRPPHPTA